MKSSGWFLATMFAAELAGGRRPAYGTARKSFCVAQNPELIAAANDGLFSSGTLGRYSRALNSVMENHNGRRRRKSRPSDSLLK